MTKNKKKTKKSNQPNPKILKPKDKLRSISKLGDLDKGTVYIPSEFIINVPISGSFRWAIEDVLHLLMKDMSVDDILVSMHKIRTGFKDVKSDNISHVDKAIWTLMSLLSEINYQAADQNLTRHTDKNINEELAGIINKLNTNDDTAARNMADYSQAWNKKFNSKDEKTESNEDSSQ